MGKIDICENNPEKSYATKVSQDIPSGFSDSTILSFKDIGNNHDVHRGKYYMKKFFESLRENTMEIINFKKKKMKLINKRTIEIIWKSKIYYICKERFENKYIKDKKNVMTIVIINWILRAWTCDM